MRQRLLVVEDHPDIAGLLRLMFPPPRYLVLTAPTLLDARTLLARLSPPDLVLLDLILPDGDGLDLCREIRAAHPRLPVLVLTARVESGAADEALAAGATRVMEKPFDPEAVQAAADALLNPDPPADADPRIAAAG
jgi:DNA-binding response OmpR family regulator